MAVTFVDGAVQVFETDNASGPTTSHTLPAPTAGGPLLEGDLLIAQISWDTSSNVAVSRTVPSGWTSLTGVIVAAISASSNVQGDVLYHFVTAAEESSQPASWTLTTASTLDSGIAVARFRGVDTADPFAMGSPFYAVTATSSNATTKVGPSVTTDTANAMVVTGIGIRSGSQTLTSVTGGYTQGPGTWTLGGRTAAIAYQAQAATGATPSPTWTHSGSVNGYTYTTALKPSTGTAAAVTGVAATATAAAPAGDLAAGAVLAGATATASGSAPAGSVQAGGEAVVQGVTAAATGTAPAGTVQAGADAVVAGVAATATASAPAGTAVGGGAPTPILRSRFAGFPDTTSGRVSTNTTDATSVRLKVGTDTAVTAGVVFGPPATPNAQGDAQLTVTGLAAGTRYYYRVAMTDASSAEILDTEATVGTFVTAPTGRASLAFNFGSCIDAVDTAAATAVANRADPLFLVIGDMYYADNSGTGVANFRSKFDAKLRAANLGRAFATAGTVYTPSDHDGMTNGSSAGADGPAWTTWNQVYREKIAAPTLPGSTGVYWTAPWGTAIRFIVLDTRSFKVVGTTVLGATQKQWLKDTITAATEQLLVIVQDAPWIGASSAGEDGWLGTIAERNEIGDFIAASSKNVVMLAGDMHAVAADDGTNSRGGFPVYHAAPLNNTASIKGGPYSSGIYPASGSALVEQYGRLVITANGDGSLTSAFTGYSANNTARITQTDNFAAPTIPATVAGATATATAAAPAGSAVIGTIIAGVAATATAAAPAGAVAAGTSVVGVVATGSCAALAGVVAVSGGGMQKWTGTAWRPLVALSPVVWDGTAWLTVPTTYRN